MTVVWYRYDDPWEEGDPIHLTEYPVLGETERTVVLVTGIGKTKRVLKEARKRFAYPTKELALASYIRRKEVQISIGRATIDRGRAYLERAEALARGEELSTRGRLPWAQLV